MVYEFKRLVISVLLLLSLGACSYVPEPKLQSASLELSEAADLLQRLNTAAVDFSEEAHRLALQTNLNLQYDLGGRPNAAFPPLFNASTLGAREQLFQKLQYYAQNISAALSARRAAVPLLDFSSIQKIDLKNIGNLSDESLTNLTAKIDQFSGIIYYPKTTRELAILADRVNPDIQRIVLLLYLDIGGLKNQSQTCADNNRQPIEPIDVKVLPDCRNGFRALTNEALLHVLKTWRNRLALALPKELKLSKSRPLLLDRIYQLQRFSQDVDEHFQKLRVAYLAFADMHANFSKSLLKKAELPRESEDYLILPKRAVSEADYPASLAKLLAGFETLSSKLQTLLRGETHDT